MVEGSGGRSAHPEGGRHVRTARGTKLGQGRPLAEGQPLEQGRSQQDLVLSQVIRNRIHTHKEGVMYEQPQSRSWGKNGHWNKAGRHGGWS